MRGERDDRWEVDETHGSSLAARRALLPDFSSSSLIGDTDVALAICILALELATLCFTHPFENLYIDVICIVVFVFVLW